MNFWQRHWKKIVGGVVGIIVLVVAASFIYAKLINDPPDKLTTSDLDDALAATDPPTTVVVTVADTAADTTATAATVAPTIETTAVASTVASADPATTVAVTAAPVTTAAPADGSGAPSVDGVWNVTQASTLRYRVTENINGFDTEGVGETNVITGALTIAGTAVTDADFTVDMTTFASDQGNRDRQFNGRIMSVDEFPTSNFVLTSPIELGAIPAEGEEIVATATGDLTLRGVTQSVTFELTAKLEGGRIGVLGNIPVLFSDYGIPNPSFGTISTEDNGLLEFILVFERA